MKSFDKNDIIQQSSKLVSQKIKQKSKNKSNMQKKPLIKTDEIDIKKIARFEDKFHKFETKHIPKHSRIVTSNEADDN